MLPQDTQLSSPEWSSALPGSKLPLVLYPQVCPFHHCSSLFLWRKGTQYLPQLTACSSSDTVLPPSSHMRLSSFKYSPFWGSVLQSRLTCLPASRSAYSQGQILVSQGISPAWQPVSVVIQLTTDTAMTGQDSLALYRCNVPFTARRVWSLTGILLLWHCQSIAHHSILKASVADTHNSKSQHIIKDKQNWNCVISVKSWSWWHVKIWFLVLNKDARGEGINRVRSIFPGSAVIRWGAIGKLVQFLPVAQPLWQPRHH